VPFYEKWGTIPNEKGRVMTTIKDGQQVIGNYVVGWIKRGPSGVIGTNKPDAVETVEMLLEDLANDKLLEPDAPNREAIEDLLNERGIQYVTFENWLKLDAIEQERGAEINRPRVKFSRVEDMLEAVGKISESLPDPAGD
jgi:ferredoxin--NADP+ reductase